MRSAPSSTRALLVRHWRDSRSGRRAEELDLEEWELPAALKSGFGQGSTNLTRSCSTHTPVRVLMRKDCMRVTSCGITDAYEESQQRGQPPQ